MSVPLCRCKAYPGDHDDCPWHGQGAKEQRAIPLRRPTLEATRLKIAEGLNARRTPDAWARTPATSVLWRFTHTSDNHDPGDEDRS